MQRRPLVAIGVATGLAVVVALSLAVGSRAIDPATVWASLVAFDPTDPDHLIVRELRVSRTVIGLLAGAALGVAGALMQSLTRNPFAEPGLLGINAGAALAVVAGIAFAGITDFGRQVWLALSGAAVAALLVHGIAGRGTSDRVPTRLALAGVAVAALLASATWGLLITSESALDEYRFWVVGSLAGRQGHDLTALVPLVLGGLVVGLMASRSLQALSLGEHAAQGLGVHPARVRAVVIGVVILLAGAATAAAGPIAFVGLAVPHVARAVVGASLPWLLVLSALGGSLLVVACDVLGRVVARPAEVAVGITTAALGGLAFAVLARHVRVADL